MMKKYLGALLALSVSGGAFGVKSFEIPQENLFIPRAVAKSGALFCKRGAFTVVLDGDEHPVARYNVKGIPPGIPADKLAEVLKGGWFQVGGDPKERMLLWKGRVLGGGKILNGGRSNQEGFPTTWAAQGMLSKSFSFLTGGALDQAFLYFMPRE